MSEFKLPDIVEKYNKEKKATKITTLSKAKAFQLKRMFSGSFAIDEMTGGGYAYRRIHLLFGAKSCIDGDSFLWYESWSKNKRMNSKGGTIRRLYERFNKRISNNIGRPPYLGDTVYFVKSVDAEGHVIRNEVKNVVKTGKKECYKVTVNIGNELISTLEHKYLTPTGYKELKDLKVGDTIYVNTNNRIKGRKKDINRPEVLVKYHPKFPIKIAKTTYKGKEQDYLYYRGQKARVVYEAFLNNMEVEQYVSFLNTASKNEIDSLIFLPQNIHIHHKDEDFLNNNLDNLELVDPSEHGKIHMRDRLNNLRIVVEEVTIVSIIYVGLRETFDIQCNYPYNNYIANGIVVHNSGKNAELNQMMAYNQRQCRVCFGIRPDLDFNNRDRWTVVLQDILGWPVCQCKDNQFQPKKFLFMDYEKTLSIEAPRIVTIKKIIDKTNSEVLIDELDYNDRMVAFSDLQSKEKLTEKQKIWIAETEQWIKNLSIEETQVEQMATTDYLQKCGVLVDELLVSDPADTEEGTEQIREVVPSKEVDGIILDSLQAMVPKYVKGREADEATMGAEPKANTLMLRHVCSSFAAGDLLDESESYKPALFINSQVRSSLGFVQTAPTYSGGHGVAHLIALALEFKREHFLKEDGTKAPFDQQFFGQKVRLRTDKTKLSAPGDMYEFDYYFRDGSNFSTGEIDHTGEIVDLGIRKGLIERAGAWYRVKEEKFNGIAELNKYFRENPSFVGNLYQDIKNK